jgi:hypothetical protein
MSAITAQHRLGLERKPGAVEAIRLPKGYSVRSNRVVRGQRGQWELTVTERVASEAIRGVSRTH